MKASELRIGNYIDSYYGIVCVEILGDLPYPCDIYTSPNKIQVRRNGGYSGIELTEEWLVKFGFTFSEAFKDHFYKYIGNQSIFNVFPFAKTKFCRVDSGYNINCEYVHQLQNLYFALTGTELTITK